MGGVRRRGRRPATDGDDATESETSALVSGEETSVIDATTDESPPSTRAMPAKSIAETVEAERQSANLATLAGLAVGMFFLYLGAFTELPRTDVAQAVIIDAGSTGTRAQVFAFRKGALVETKMVSSPNRIVGLGFGAPAGQFFKSLLDDVRASVPGTKRRRSVPMALRATAGLRLAGHEVAENALNEARKALNSSGFLVKPEWVSVLDDQEEAIGAWSTVNYLTGHLNGTVPTSTAVVELGGGSLQVVFEANEEVEKAVEEQEKQARSAGSSHALKALIPRMATRQLYGRERKLVTLNRLGFGLNDFTKKLFLLFESEGVLEQGNPCFRKGKHLHDKKLLLGVTGSEEERVVTIMGDGDFERCVASAEIVLMQYGPLDKNIFEHIRGDVVAFAFIYDLTVKLGISEAPSEAELFDLGKRLCEGNGDIAQDRDEVCAEFSYVYLLLREITGGFREDLKLRLVQVVDGHVLGWALGSVLTDFAEELEAQLTN